MSTGSMLTSTALSALSVWTRRCSMGLPSTGTSVSSVTVLRWPATTSPGMGGGTFRRRASSPGTWFPLAGAGLTAMCSSLSRSLRMGVGVFWIRIRAAQVISRLGLVRFGRCRWHRVWSVWLDRPAISVPRLPRRLRRRLSRRCFRGRCSTRMRSSRRLPGRVCRYGWLLQWSARSLMGGTFMATMWAAFSGALPLRRSPVMTSM